MGVFINGVIGIVDFILNIVIAVIKFLLGDVLMFMGSREFMSIINILIILAGIIISIVILVGVICRLVGVEPGEIDKAIFIVQKNIYKKYFLR